MTSKQNSFPFFIQTILFPAITCLIYCKTILYIFYCFPVFQVSAIYYALLFLLLSLPFNALSCQKTCDLSIFNLLVLQMHEMFLLLKYTN